MRYLVYDNYKVIVDYEKNFQFYFATNYIEESCYCPACRNFRTAIANQIIPYYGINKKRISYGGYFHCCGNILSNGYLTETIKVSDNFKISFQKECDLKNESMPSPSFQINFKIDLPWLIKEDNVYCWSPKTSRQRRLSI